MKSNLSLILILIFLNTFSACGPGANDSKLRARVRQYYDYILAKDYEKAWEMLAEESKSWEKWPKESWISAWQQDTGEEKVNGFFIDSVKIKKKDGRLGATIKVKARIEFMKGKKRVIEDRKGLDFWFYENGDWYRFQD
jgi:lipopolysaccharide export LptBFGC system permease protein LptF